VCILVDNMIIEFIYLTAFYKFISAFVYFDPSFFTRRHEEYTAIYIH
jgi:hypothetical protein